MILRARAVLTSLGAALLVALLGMTTLLGLAAPAAAAPSPAAAGDPSPVVLVAVAGLQWSDVDADRTPHLWRLVSQGSVGSMAVRTLTPTCPRDAWLTISAGSRFVSPRAADGEPAAADACRAVPYPSPQVASADGTPGPAVVEDWADVLRSDERGSYGTPGALGTALAAAGTCTTAIGPGAGLALADDAGRLARYSPSITGVSAVELAACPVTVIDAGALPDRASGRSEALRELDADLGKVMAAAPDGTRVVVSGVADTPLGAPTLQVVVDWTAPGGAEPTWIDSRSSRWQGIAVLDDLSATLGGPATGDGSVLEAGEVRRMTTSRTVDNRRYLTVLTDTVAHLSPVLVAGLGVASAVTLLVVGLRRRRARAGVGTPRLGAAVLLVTAAAPAGATLATLSRWWVWPAPTTALAVAVAVGTLAVALAAWYGRLLLPRSPLRLATAVAGLTWLVLTVDGVTGTTLQQGSLLGPSPAFGARFFGFGNTVFAVYAVSGLVLAWGLAAVLAAAGRRRAAVAVVATLGVVTVLVNVLPRFGADAGGLVALVPAFAVLLYGFTQRRLSPLRATVVVVAVTVVAVVGIALAVWLSPGHGSHLGAFVQRLLDGGALAVVRSKAAGAWATVASVPGVLAVLGCAAAAWATLRPEHARLDSLAAVYRAEPSVRTLVGALWTAAAVGTLANDSGIAVALVVLLAATPTLAAAPLTEPVVDAGTGTLADAGSPAPRRPAERAAGVAGALRAPARLVAVACGMLGVLLLGAVVVPASNTVTRAGDVTQGGTDVLTGDAPVVLVGTAGVTWADVSPRATPTLWSLLRDGADAGGVTPAVVDTNRQCSGAGWLGLSAGRTVVTGTREGASFACEPWSVSADGQAPGEARVDGWDALTAAQSSSPFRPRLGTLGEALGSAGVCATAVGPGAALALADQDGAVARYVPAEQLTADAFTCPLTVVDAGAAPSTEPDRAAALAEVDATVRRALATAPDGATVLVVDVGDPATTAPALGVGLVQGTSPAAARYLSSAATRWEGVVRLLDLPVSLAAALDMPQPADFAGSPALSAGTRPTGAEQTVHELALITERDRALRRVAGTTTAIPLWIGLGAFGAAVLVLPRLRRRAADEADTDGPRTSAARRRERRVRLALDGLLLVLASIPAGQFLMGAFSWWLPSASPGRLWAALVASTLLVAAVGALAPRRPAWAAPTVIATITFVLLTIDAVLGTPLHRGSPLGPSPTLGGRFFGFGNPTYSVYVGAGLVAAAGLATLAAGRWGRRWAGAVVGVVGIVAMVIDLWPDFGADVGGGLVVLPTFAVLALAVSGARVTWSRLLAVAVAGLVLVAGIGVLDWMRPVTERTHLGTFVQSVIDGSALDTVWRKAGFALRTVTRGPEAWITLALLVAIIVVLVGWLRAGWLDRAAADWPTLTPLLAAMLVGGMAGAFVNDYGVRIVTIMMFTVVPLVGLLVVRGDQGPLGERPPRGWRAAA
ncbi:hypothetical protein [Xylanimonas sp. McL0601]|uniref:hypothetical protein n=1 Tax=Xylanimonas sp. McL0601 TaxID=3414739 RepID=UPI003CEE1780